MGKQPEDLEAMYLSAADPRGESGFRGDAGRWEALRRPVLKAVNRGGSFLDIGCANGHFLECAVAWAAQDGHRLDPYGLDRSAALVARAKGRLPEWADRFLVGDAWTFVPPRRYAFVRSELVYVPRSFERRFVERLLTLFVEPGGRLIIAWYGGGSAPRRKGTMAEVLQAWGHAVAGQDWADDPWGRGAFTDVAWVEAPAAP